LLYRSGAFIAIPLPDSGGVAAAAVAAETVPFILSFRYAVFHTEPPLPAYRRAAVAPVTKLSIDTRWHFADVMPEPPLPPLPAVEA
jgi:hypothetical protein